MPATAPRSRSTFQAKADTAHGWFVADVEGQTLGRAATKIADVLRGKHRPTFTPHQDAGDFVIVVNADKVKLSKDKWDTKLYRDHSLFPGERVKRGVWGMLPRGPLGRQIYRKLKVYAGAKHPHAAQEPQVLKF